MVLTDYAPEAVARLRDLFPEVEVLGADLRDTPPVRADVHLFHRIDSELSDAEWRDLLERFRDERLVVVATEVLGPRRILEEMLLRMPGRNASSAGWTRTRDAFEALWRPTHDAQPIDAFDLMAWSLQPRNRRQGRG
jgi:hypothetical protein